ncbi:MAG: glutaminyl-peptide cyclotransferase [Thermodesulfobacteriota bacterium]
MSNFFSHRPLPRLFPALLIWAAFLCFCPPPAIPSEIIPVSGYKVVATHPHDPTFFTQGLAFHGGFLYEGTGQYGQSLLCRRTVGGRIELLRRLPSTLFGEGVTVFGDRVIQLTWKSGVGLVWDRESLRMLRFFSYAREGWGLTDDGRHLIMSDGSAQLTFLHPDTFAPVKRVRVTAGDDAVEKLNELEYVKGEVWANVWKEKRIARIDPVSGRVTGWIDLTTLVDVAAPPGEDSVLNGIAYDPAGERIFVTGKYWDRMFEIRLIGP